MLLYEMLIGQSPFQGSSEDELFQNICQATVRYPKWISEASISILGQVIIRISTIFLLKVNGGRFYHS